MQKTIKIREKGVEDYFMNQVKKMGGFAIKYKSPDRILFFDGRCHLIELKAPGKKPRELQKAIFKKLANQGFPVVVLDTKSRVDLYLNILKVQQELG